MADLEQIKRSAPSTLTGGDELYEAKVNRDGELSIRDTHDNGGLDAILALTTAPKLGVTNIDGVTPKPNRKYFVMEATSSNVVWGFSATTQSFDLFKSQIIMVPVGPDTEIWFKMKSGTGNVSVGEIS